MSENMISIKHCEAMERACKLTLLFHSGSPWDDAKIAEWCEHMHALVPTGPNLHVAKYEATTKNLCTAIRAALSV